MNFKLVISDPKNKKAYQKEMDQNQTGITGKKICDRVSGDSLGLAGYELEITGGSDRQGFPMRGDVEGLIRKRILLSLPPGFHPKLKGQRKRKSVRGNTISVQISQVNLKVVTYGKDPLDKVFGAKPKPKEEKKEAKPEEKPTEAEAGKEPEKPVEEKKAEEPKEEKPAEEKMGIKELEKVEKEVKEKGVKEKVE